MNIRRFRVLHEVGSSYTKIARECGADPRTVKKYLEADADVAPPGAFVRLPDTGLHAARVLATPAHRGMARGRRRWQTYHTAPSSQRRARRPLPQSGSRAFTSAHCRSEGGSAGIACSDGRRSRQACRRTYCWACLITVPCRPRGWPPPDLTCFDRGG